MPTLTQVFQLIKIVILYSLFADNSIQAQPNKVDYKITATLDVYQRVLHGTMTIRYSNNTDSILNELKIHTWMNVFKATKSEYASQLRKTGDDRKYKLSKQHEGGYKSLSFHDLQGKDLPYYFSTPSNEILTLPLRHPIPPHSSDSLLCSFTLDIPKNISRGGHIGSSYQMTQWYPKVALLNLKGWQTMPYLEIGEFFNEFGDYDVSIVLPENYIVGATGTLLNADEKQKLIGLSSQDDSTRLKYSSVKSSPASFKTKTLRYEAKMVTDFAWFADKDFHVKYDTVVVNQEKKEIFSFYYPSKLTVWNESTSYCKSALQFLSHKIGTYPYPQISIVECNRTGSDGMEYPMITLIDKGYSSNALELEKVIVHETAHNWFQAVVSTNERKDAWMDESMVSFLEKDYFKGKYWKTYLSDAPLPFLTDYDKTDDFPWYLQAVYGNDASAKNDITNFSLLGYIQSIYEKPAKGFKLMNKVLGDSLFNLLLQDYYATYQFKHPGGSDFIHILNKYHVHWFDSLYLTSTKKINIGLKKTSKGVSIINNFLYPVPVEIEGYKKGKPIWNKTVNSNDEVVLENEETDYILADPNFLLPEIHRTDNILRLKKSPFNPKKSEIKLIPGIGHSLTKEFYIHPILGFNQYDRFYPGFAFHNINLPSNNFLAGIVAGYSFTSNRLVGITGMEYSLFPQSGGVRQVKFGLEYRSFSIREEDIFTFKDEYYSKFSPFVTLKLNQKSQTKSDQTIKFRSLTINKYATGIPGPENVEKEKRSYTILELSYQNENKIHLFPHRLKVNLELSKGYFNLNTFYIKKWLFKYGKNTHLEYSIFSGIQKNKGTLFNSAFTVSGHTTKRSDQLDYKYDELLFGRNEPEGVFSRQLFHKDAGFNSLSHAVLTNRWLVAGSIKVKFVDFLPIKPFAQLAIAPDTKNQKQTFFTSGISLVILKDLVELSFPIVENKNIKAGYTAYQNIKYWNRCPITINFKDLNPMKWLDKLAR